MMALLRRLPFRSLLILASLCGGAWFVVAILPWKLGTPTSTPEDAFKRAFGKPVPPGVSNIVAVHRQYAIEEWVWLRFHTTNKALATILGSAAMEDNPFVVQKALRGPTSVNPKYDAVDKRTVGWPQIARIPKPQV